MFAVYGVFGIDEQTAIPIVRSAIDSMEILEQAFEAVRTFHPLSNQELEALLAKTAATAVTGRFEPFKTTSIFDSTAQNPLRFKFRGRPLSKLNVFRSCVTLTPG